MDSLPSAHRRAKRPATRVAGPYGHPFHPMIIPVPIGAFVIALVFDLASYWVAEPTVFARGSYWLIVIGIVSGVVAAVFGAMDAIRIPLGTRAFKAAMAHMTSNVTALGLYTVSLALRHGRLDEGPVAIAPLVVSIVALTSLGLGGWLGGELTYRHGIRVADEPTQADAYRS